MGEHAISLKDVTLERSEKKNTFRMEHLNLELKKGCLTGLIGRNGAGKTTLLQAIASNSFVKGGEIRYDGATYWEDDVAIRKKMSWVCDHPNFNFSRRPEQLAKVVEACEPWFDRAYFTTNLKRFGIPMDQKVKEMSAGTVKKLQLVLALSRRPDILLLDEPTSGVDPVSRGEMLDLMQEFMQDPEHAILFSTHVTEDLDLVADYIVMLEGGAIVLDEEKEALKERWSEAGVLPSIEELMVSVIDRG